MNVVRQMSAGLRLMVVFTVVLGLLYPLAGVAFGKVIADSANGSLVEVEGSAVGSSLLGQSFDGDEWFIPRPSVSDYDAMASGGSNLGPNNPDLVAEIAERRSTVAQREGVPADQVPPDAVTASASGLDPAISPEYADLQVPRVARARGLSEQTVRVLVAEATTPAGLGFLGEPSVNVLELNLSLDRAQ
jgi:K+-transporting ATPase ATPase C chain